MTNKLFSILLILSFFKLSSCSDSTRAKKTENSSADVALTQIDSVAEPTAIITKQNPMDFMPESFVLFEKVLGDLNKDGLEDCILVVKGTQKEMIIQDEYLGELDRNRRGIIILIHNKDGYELALKNINCFASEHEDGGAYYAPELSVYVRKGNLYVSFEHGKYGGWSYTFRAKDADFELIGYDANESNGPVIYAETSINFLSKKKIVKKNTNREAEEEGMEVFEETLTKINTAKRIKLSEIKDFDALQEIVLD